MEKKIVRTHEAFRGIQHKAQHLNRSSTADVTSTPG
uniref:Uncharacterized protein n=1 Tax=Anguilla anguilla TaxID=7936 RepID=A0A0E9WR48_ANGAN